MYLGVARVAACAAVLLAGSALAAHAGPCGAANVSSFSRLAQAVEEARAGTRGTLLATWLIRPRDAANCRLVFRVDLLMQDGRVQSMNFDAETLDRVEINDDHDWVEAGGAGAGGESAAAGGGGARGGDDDKDKDDDGKDDDDRDDSGNSGPGSSSSGSGSGDDGGHDSSGSGGNSGRGGGDDSGGSDGSGSGGGSGGSGSGGGGGGSGSGGGGDD